MKVSEWAWLVSGLGFVIIVAGTWFLVYGPTSAPAPVSTTTQGDVVVELPYSGAVTGKTFSVIGKARGTWYFEGSFPVVLLDKDGKVLDQKPAQAEGEWMTTEYVPFKVELTAPESYIGPATVVLKKDNPSGDPERDASVTIPITVEY